MSPEARLLRAWWLAVLAGFLGGCASTGRSSEPGSAAPPAAAAESSGADASGEPVEAIDGIALDELTDTERELWVELVNAELSPCGEPTSVGRCAAQAGGCARCKGAVRYLVRLVMEGFDRETIGEHYAARYAPDQEVVLALGDAPVRGPAEASVTLVVFSDFECPHCGKAHGLLTKLLASHPELRLVFKHCPLLQHPRALPAARAAEAARMQGRFWDMHDRLFENQRALEDADLERYATELGLDLERFRADVGSPEVQARIDADLKEGARVGVRGTPAVFVDGRRFDESVQALDAYVQEALSR